MSLPLSQLPDPGRRARNGLTIMIVEDEALIAFSLEEVCEDAGYRVVGPFASCAAALLSLVTSLPDVAVLDATLSDGPCLELALELRRRGVPFMIYSGRDAFQERPPELDGVVWVEKPNSFQTVLQAAEKLLGRG
jgi:DNA-binding response OmpR family regulator